MLKIVFKTQGKKSSYFGENKKKKKRKNLDKENFTDSL